MEDLETDPELIIADLELDLAELEFQQKHLESYTALELSKMEIEPVKRKIIHLILMTPETL